MNQLLLWFACIHTILFITLAGVSNLLTSLGHTGRIILGHTLNTETLMKTEEQKKKKVLSKFTVLRGAAFVAILGRSLDTPDRVSRSNSEVSAASPCG